jgi:hypothetical protein
MVDLTSPWPWPMTILELCGFIPAVLAVLATIALDVWRRRGG